MVFEEKASAKDDLVLSGVLLIVGDNAELAVIAYKAIQQYLTREDITLPEREK